MVTSQCEQCKATIDRRGNRPGRFCSLDCKGEWQRTQKPVDRGWLYQRYVVDGWSTYRIAREVGRDPKRVHTWLVDFGIPTRVRGWKADVSGAGKGNRSTGPLADSEWVRAEYVDKQRSTGDIARALGVTDANVIYFLRKYGIPRRTLREARAVKRWGSFGADNPMHGRNGPANPNWQGGHTPERQAFYSSAEWTKAARIVRRRDKRTCQRCGAKSRLHIHHIEPFAVKSLRAEPLNLITLCIDCHQWVHSRRNTGRAFLGASAAKGGAI